MRPRREDIAYQINDDDDDDEVAAKDEKKAKAATVAEAACADANIA